MKIACFVLPIALTFLLMPIAIASEHPFVLGPVEYRVISPIERDDRDSDPDMRISARVEVQNPLEHDAFVDLVLQAIGFDGRVTWEDYVEGVVPAGGKAILSTWSFMWEVSLQRTERWIATELDWKPASADPTEGLVVTSISHRVEEEGFEDDFAKYSIDLTIENRAKAGRTFNLEACAADHEGFVLDCESFRNDLGAGSSWRTRRSSMLYGPTLMDIDHWIFHVDLLETPLDWRKEGRSIESLSSRPESQGQPIQAPSIAQDEADETDRSPPE